MRAFAFLIPVAALVACSGAPQAAAESNGDTPRTLTVSGSGETSAAPDMAVVTIGVVTQAKTAADALRENSANMKTTMAKLKRLGVAEKDIQTSGLSVNPRYEYDQNRTTQKIVGFTASNTLTLKLRDLTVAGAIIDEAVQSGANRLGGVAFGFADPKPLMDEARIKAVADARARAALYAKAADVRLGRILSIQDGYASAPSPKRVRAGFAMDAVESVPIASGEETVSASVSIVYEIE